MRILQYLANRIARVAPWVALNAVRSVYGSGSFNWSGVDVPARVEGFEDLSFLFWSSPLNRGLLRLDLDEAAALYKTVKSVPNARGVEIGRFNGGSTVMLASAVGPGGNLLSIDTAPRDDRALTTTLSQMNLLDRVELVVADANEIERDVELDFAFIDGDHTYEGAKNDHNRWGAKVCRGGYIIHHDMGHGRRLATQLQPLAALKAEIATRQRDVLEPLREVGSLTIFMRRDSPWIGV